MGTLQKKFLWGEKREEAIYIHIPSRRRGVCIGRNLGNVNFFLINISSKKGGGKKNSSICRKKEEEGNLSGRIENRGTPLNRNPFAKGRKDES